eukprot:Rmarinus@m.28335
MLLKILNVLLVANTVICPLSTAMAWASVSGICDVSGLWSLCESELVNWRIELTRLLAILSIVFCFSSSLMIGTIGLKEFGGMFSSLKVPVLGMGLSATIFLWLQFSVVIGTLFWYMQYCERLYPDKPVVYLPGFYLFLFDSAVCLALWWALSSYLTQPEALARRNRFYQVLEARTTSPKYDITRDTISQPRGQFLRIRSS